MARNDKPADVVAYWLSEIAAAKKRENDYRKDGARILEIYEGKKRDEVPFNILYSNIETMLPALYSAVPRPVVQRRFKDDDPLGKHAAVAGQRVLEFLLDTNIEGYETFDQGMKMATLDALLPGRGVTSVKYEMEEGVMERPEDAPPDYEPTPYKKSELVCLESRIWNRVYFGYAKKWSKVPWVAYEEYIDKEEATRLFGKKIANEINYTTGEESERSEDGYGEDERDTGERKTALVYQIWDRDGGRKVRYVSPHYPDGFLRVDDDPLQLTGFFNCPRPLCFLEKSNDLTPVALYVLYENQARELNEITRRLSRVVRAIRAKAVYDSALGDDIKKLVEADDNQLVPADKAASLVSEKGLQNAIWFWPIEQLVNVANQLILAREQCKRTIYEIMGVSDIIRGSTVASETASAQRLKSEWGTLRLRPKQTEVQRYARDLLRIMLEIAATKFSEETWAKMTGLPFLLETRFHELTTLRAALMQKVQQEQVQAELMAAEAAQAGMPVPQSTPTPSMLELQRVEEELLRPKWSSVLELLRNDIQRAYRIDIETNSTVEPEAVEDQKNISEVMTALGQFLNGVTPLVVSGTMPFQAAQSMMLAITRRFRFGPEIEDYIKSMQPPKPPDDSKERAAKEENLRLREQQAQKDAAAAQERMQAQARIAQLETDLNAMQEQNKLIARKAELDVRELQLQIREQQLRIHEERTTEKIQTREQIFQAKNAADQKVRALQDAGARRDLHIVKQANDNMSAIHQTVQQMAELQSRFLAAISEQTTQMQQMMAGVLKALTAPRRNRAIRGKDGRIEETISEVAQ